MCSNRIDVTRILIKFTLLLFLVEISFFRAQNWVSARKCGSGDEPELPGYELALVHVVSGCFSLSFYCKYFQLIKLIIIRVSEMRFQ